MAGQHIDRAERAEKTGLTVQERNAQIVELHNRGYTERQIAKHFDVANSNVHYIIAASKGVKRIQGRKEMCEGCWEDFYATLLDKTTGYCPDCQKEV